MAKLNMDPYFKKIDKFSQKLTSQVIHLRWVVIFVTLIIVLGFTRGMSSLEFSSNYRVFFSDNNPELAAFEDLQATYTKNDNILFVMEPKNKKKEGVFNNITLSAVEKLTAEAWKIPYTIRVDSLSNFQYTHSIGDDLIVEDLVIDAESLSSLELSKKRETSLEEPLLRNNLVTTNSAVTAINVVLQYPDLNLLEVPEAVRAARDLRQLMEVDFPDIKIHLTGVSMLNNAFSEVGLLDAGTLTPIMFIVILLISWLILRFFCGNCCNFFSCNTFNSRWYGCCWILWNQAYTHFYECIYSHTHACRS